MRLFFRSTAIATLLLAPLAAHADCWPKAIRILQASSPEGYAIYTRTTQADFFRGWIDCADAEFDLSTAVHESTHFVTGEADAFPLVGGGEVARPHEVSQLMPPWRIAAQFGSDSYTAVYLKRGKASSASDFLYLLDELNAYTHDLSAAVDLKALRSRVETVDHRDGLAALMAFTSAYAETARAQDAATWQGLHAPRAQTTIVTLWAQAERVMAASCGISNYGAEDKAYIARVCAAGPQSAIATILGRAPACPAACLVPEPASAEAGQDQMTSEDDSSTGSIAPSGDQTTVARTAGELPRHPFALAVGPRRHKRVKASRAQD